jgi:phenylacetate-coenzyme A ligase PaaK-like adenylate-forming protein
MLIYKATNVFPATIRDVVLKYLEPLLTGYVQVIKDYPQQVRFDDPIPVDIKVRETSLDPGKLKREIEDKARDMLTVRITANLVEPGTIQRTQYKTPLVRLCRK